MNDVEHTPSGHSSKIKWGALIAGAGIAVAAVVGFVFFPDAAYGAVETIKQLLTNSYNAVGDAGTWVLEKIFGGTEPGTVGGALYSAGNSVFETVKSAGTWIGDKVIGGLTPEAAQHVKDLGKQAAELVASGDITEAEKKFAEASFSEIAKPATTQGLIGFIMNHKLISTAAAALGAYGLSKHLGSKNEFPLPRSEADESFAMKEDMRRMESLLAMRAAYAGYPQDAMQQGRA